MDLITVIPWFVLGNSVYLFITMARRLSKRDAIAWEWMIVSGLLGAFAGVIIALKLPEGPVPGGLSEEWTWLCLILFVLLFIAPAMLMYVTRRFQDAFSYRAAWLTSTFAMILHPFPSSYHNWQIARFHALMGSGKLDLAAEMLRETPEPHDMQSLVIYISMLRLLWRWDDAVRLIESMPPQQRLEPSICSAYLPCLAELERIPDLFTTARNFMEAYPNLGPFRDYMYIVPCASAGRMDLILSLFNGPLYGLATPLKEHWLAVTLQRAGRQLEARVLLEKLKDSPLFLVQRGARQRLQQPMAAVNLSSDEDAHVVLRYIEKDLRDEGHYIERSHVHVEDGAAALLGNHRHGDADAEWLNPARAEATEAARTAAHFSVQKEVHALHSRANLFRPWATWAIAASIIGVFALDSFLSEPGATDSLTESVQTWIRQLLPAKLEYGNYEHPLEQVGVYSYVDLIKGEYWRLVTPLFLHANLVHLGFNTMALLSFGPSLERVLGRFRYLLLYFICGLAGTLAMTWFIHAGWMKPLYMLGASGSIMGLVGATAWILLHRSVWDKQVMAREQLGQILLLLGLQTAFDLSNPQVSFTAHSLGALTGFLVAILLYAQVRETAVKARPG